MADGISGLGAAAKEMIADLQKQMVQNNPAEKVGGQDFGAVLAQKAQDPSQVAQAGQVESVQKSNTDLQTSLASALKTNRVESQQKVNSTSKTEGGNVSMGDPEGANKDPYMRGFKSILSGVVEGQNKLDDVIKLSLSGQKFDQQELLAIQASVYKFNQELDLTSKVVEKATSGVKQTLQTQV